MACCHRASSGVTGAKKPAGQITNAALGAMGDCGSTGAARAGRRKRLESMAHSSGSMRTAGTEADQEARGRKKERARMRKLSQISTRLDLRTRKRSATRGKFLARIPAKSLQSVNYCVYNLPHLPGAPSAGALVRGSFA